VLYRINAALSWNTHVTGYTQIILIMTVEIILNVVDDADAT